MNIIFFFTGFLVIFFSGNKKLILNRCQYINVLKTNKVLMQTNLEVKHFVSFLKKKKNNFENVTTVYQLAKFFIFDDLDKRSFCYIKRFFNVVYETKKFLELDFSHVAKIISSFELNIDSELEVLTAARYWVDHDFEKRKNFAKIIFSKIRLTLLPEQYLKKVLNKSIFFSKNSECVKLLDELVQEKKVFFPTQSKNDSSYRSCTLDSFSFIFTGGITENDETGI